MPRLQKLADHVKTDLFADIVLNQDQDGAAQRADGGNLRRLLDLDRQVPCNVGADNGCDFAIHGKPVLSCQLSVLSRVGRTGAAEDESGEPICCFYCPR